mgnify:FL=1
MCDICLNNQPSSQMFTGTSCPSGWIPTVMGQNPCVSFGCTNPMATNYNAFATVDDGSCIIVVGPSTPGCTNPQAANYNPNATVDDGSCILVSTGGLGDLEPDLGEFGGSGLGETEEGEEAPEEGGGSGYR